MEPRSQFSDSLAGLQRVGMSRREALRFAALSVGVGSCSGWLSSLAAGATTQGARRKQCIALWTTGGLSQLETFDMKPRYSMFRPIATSVTGLQICDKLPKLARLMNHAAIIRSSEGSATVKESIASLDHACLMTTAVRRGAALK